MKNVGQAFDTAILSRVLNYMKPYKGRMVLATVLTLMLTVLAPLRPYLVQYTIDHYVLTPFPEKLLYATIALVAMVCLQGLIQYLHTYITNWLGQQLIHDIRQSLYKKITHLKVGFFDKTPVGTIITRCVSDLETIADILSEGLIVIIGDILQLIAIIGFMFYQDWRLTLVSLSTIPVLLIATNVFKNGIKSTFNDVRNQVARLNTFVQEHISGMSVVQIFNREEQESVKFEEVNRLHRDANIKSVWYYSVFFPVVEILSAISIGAVVWYGASEVLDSRITVGTLVAFIMYINMLFRPIRELADKFNTLQMGMVSSERVFKLLDSDEITVDEGQNTNVDLAGSIEFKNVWFAYNDEHWILKDVSFKLEAGCTLALVGATGAGKSSIISLLNRFYENQKGQILINGVDIKEIPVKQLRSSIALVLQDVFLFSDSIYSNIALGNDQITRAEVTEAIRLVEADRFVNKLEGGIDFQVRERGASLSLGQRQLLAFVRAYVQNPQILVLDEATSSIDSESEELIQNATEKLTKNRTSIVIAHRLSTVVNANKIIVLDKGEVIEQGSHHELLGMKGPYYELFQSQFEIKEPSGA